MATVYRCRLVMMRQYPPSAQELRFCRDSKILQAKYYKIDIGARQGTSRLSSQGLSSLDMVFKAMAHAKPSDSVVSGSFISEFLREHRLKRVSKTDKT